MVFSLVCQVGHYYVFLHASDGGFRRLAWWDGKQCYCFMLGAAALIHMSVVKFIVCIHHLNVPRFAFSKSLKSILQSWISFLDTETLLFKKNLRAYLKVTTIIMYVCVNICVKHFIIMVPPAYMRIWCTFQHPSMLAELGPFVSMD